jgi:hypothetical protein
MSGSETDKAPEAITQGNCGHTRVLIRDFCNQPVELNGPCIFCYRDTLQSSLERTERELREAQERVIELDTERMAAHNGWVAANARIRTLEAENQRLRGALKKPGAVVPALLPEEITKAGSKDLFRLVPSFKVSRTQLTGFVTCSFDRIREILGEPNCEGDGIKVSTQWCIAILVGDREVVATIYDYKATEPDNRVLVENFRRLDSYEWHVGGIGLQNEPALVATILGLPNWRSI